MIDYMCIVGNPCNGKFEKVYVSGESIETVKKVLNQLGVDVVGILEEGGKKNEKIQDGQEKK